MIHGNVSLIYMNEVESHVDIIIDLRITLFKTFEYVDNIASAFCLYICKRDFTCDNIYLAVKFSRHLYTHPMHDSTFCNSLCALTFSDDCYQCQRHIITAVVSITSLCPIIIVFSLIEPIIFHKHSNCIIEQISTHKQTTYFS